MIEAYLDGTGEVVAYLGSLDKRMTEELRVAISKLSIRLQTNVKENKLSGQVLGVRTGRGKRSIQQAVSVDGNRVVGAVSTNVFYMIGWETGWEGANERSMKAAKAKYDLSGGGGGDTFKNGTPKKRPFLVPALKEMASSGQIQSEIDAAIGRAV